MYSVQVTEKDGSLSIHPMADSVDFPTAECIRGYCELHGLKSKIIGDEFDINSPFPYGQSQEARDALEKEYEPLNVE